VAEFLLTSTAVVDGGTIPRRYTCDGEDRSPPLLWSAPPAGTGSLAMVLDDLDAPGGRFIHWLAWDMTPDIAGLGEGEAAPLEGRNDFGTVGYRGPCPPGGHGRHRYRFRRHCCIERSPRATASTSPLKDDRSWHGRVVRPFLGVLP
jgi:Raf kinase inhibitor-like YbhB/YbcL family protein